MSTVRIFLGNVNIKPGKSTAFATCTFNNKTKYILCLPGNPVSVLTTAHLFLLPLVNWMHYNFQLETTIVNAKVKLFIYNKIKKYIYEYYNVLL